MGSVHPATPQLRRQAPFEQHDHNSLTPSVLSYGNNSSVFAHASTPQMGAPPSPYPHHYGSVPHAATPNAVYLQQQQHVPLPPGVPSPAPHSLNRQNYNHDVHGGSFASHDGSVPYGLQQHQVNHSQGAFHGGSVASHTGSAVSYGVQQHQQQVNQSQGASFAHGGKENVENAAHVPPVPSQIISTRGVDAASTGMSTLSVNESSGEKKIEQKKNIHENMCLPDFHGTVMMDSFQMNQFIQKASSNALYAVQTSSTLQSVSRKHKGLKSAKALYEQQLAPYETENERCQAGIDDVRQRRQDSATTRQNNMAEIADEKKEQLRAAVAKIDAEYAEKMAKEEKEMAQEKRDLDAEEKKWREKKQKNKEEKQEHLTLAKATLLSFDTGVEIVDSVSQLEKNKGNQQFHTRLEANKKLLGQYQECFSAMEGKGPDVEKAMWTLKDMVWDDDSL